MPSKHISLHSGFSLCPRGREVPSPLSIVCSHPRFLHAGTNGMQQRDLLLRAGIQESQVIVERRKMFHSSGWVGVQAVLGSHGDLLRAFLAP